MNSGDVHRHQAHPPLAQHVSVGGGAHGGHGWYTTSVPPAPVAAAPTAPQRAKRLAPPPTHTHPTQPIQQVTTTVSGNGSGPPLSPNAIHTAAATTHNNCAMTSSVRAPPLIPMHTSQTSNHFRAGSGGGKGANDLLVTSCGASAPSWLANLSSMPWHHGAISRERAEQLLSNSQDGVFLIRESTNFPGDHTLCVRFRGHVEHYRIKWAPAAGGSTQRLTIDDEEYFNNMSDLIDHYLKDADGLCTCLVRCLPKQPNGPATNNNGAHHAAPAYTQGFHHQYPLHPPTQPPSQPAPFPPSRPLASSQNKTYSNDQTDSGTGSVLGPQAFADAGWIIRECDLEIGENIGKGEFGDVMLGILYRTKKVAVKILKDKEAAGKFLAEASLMTSLKHENLVQLLGLVFTSTGATCIVTEHMAQGNLLDYLRSRGRQLVTPAHQINFAYDTCCGMEFLEARHVVHRDLAARNVLIAADGTAKVADFGLARPDNTRVDDPHTQAKLPIKWTAPEALKYNKFSNKSDMWSFGILLWEIYSFGRVPYPRISLNDVVKAVVEEGHRMDRPDGCPALSYELMCAAWHADPERRPSFAQARQRLRTLRDQTNPA